MWESRVSEISKFLWKPFFGFHRDVISAAVFAVVHGGSGPRPRGCCSLTASAFVVPSASYAVGFVVVWLLEHQGRCHAASSDEAKISRRAAACRHSLTRR